MSQAGLQFSPLVRERLGCELDRVFSRGPYPLSEIDRICAGGTSLDLDSVNKLETLSECADLASANDLR